VRRQRRVKAPKLRPCIVHTERYSTTGLLYRQTKRHVILVNNVRERADLGSLKRIRRKHLDPEATVIVIPRETVTSIDKLGRK